MSATEVDIIVATYRLPDGLRRALSSLERQVLEPSTRCRVIVVDNDPEQTARPVAEAHWPFPVLYDVEPIRGTTEVRNRALRHTTAEFVAILDDDQVADAHWLEALLDTTRRYHADVVFGANILVFPAGTHPVKRHLLQVLRSPTGTRQAAGATGNSLLRRKILERLDFWFDPRHGLTGNGDTDFFWRLGDRGACMVQCDEAITHEPYPASRVAWSWILPRRISIGQTCSRLWTAGFSPRRRQVQALYWTGVALWRALLIPWGARRGWSGLAWRLDNFLFDLGLASGAWGWRLSVYGTAYWRNQT